MNYLFNIFDLMDVMKSGLRIGFTIRVLSGRWLDWLIGKQPTLPVLIRETFEELGATYIKLGQFIASTPSLFPPNYVQEFQLCLDQTTPLPFTTIYPIIKKELNQPVHKVFSEIDPKPLASASIAQVHAAKLISGEDVVLKIQKPGVEDVLKTDLNFLYLGLKVLDYIIPGFSQLSLSEIISDIHQTMMDECDFIKEASHIKQFKRFLSDTENDMVVAPVVYDHATSKRILTMERFYGVPLTDLNAIEQYVEDPELTLVTAMNTWFSSLMMCDFFHADVHAGNLMVLQDGRIGFIDFGIVGRIPKSTWEGILSMIQGMGEMDYKRIAHAMVNIGMTSQEVNIDSLAYDLQNLSHLMSNFDPEQMLITEINEKDLNQLLYDMASLGERHGIRFPKEFALLIKQFLYFDRYIRILSPEMQLFDDERLNLLPDIQF